MTSKSKVLLETTFERGLSNNLLPRSVPSQTSRLLWPVQTQTTETSIWFFALFLTILSLSISCATKTPPQQPSEPVILTLGNKTFTTEEFFQSFSKNQFSDDTAKKTSIENYLKLFTALKIKVLAAQSAKKDSTEGFKTELASYRKILAKPYLEDKVLIDNMVAEAYQNLKEEIKLSHILVAVPAEASPADTLAAYRAALALRGRIVNDGEDFADMAKKFSKDVATAAIGGDLGYLVAFQTVYPIEVAAYKLKIGQVSEPVRTSAGYHLLKVVDRRPARGMIQVAHILVRMSASATDEGKRLAKSKIESAYERLKQEAWEIVCREFSDDATTKINGGLLPSFNTGENVKEFEEAAYALQNVGDVSQPVLTNYGWHIIKLVSRKPVPPFADMANSLRQKIVTNTRGEVIQAALTQKLRKTYEIDEASGMPNDVFEKIDTTLLQGTWKLTPKIKALFDKKTMFSIEKRAVSANDFFEYLQIHQEPKPAGTSLKMLLNRYYQNFIDKQLIKYEEDNLEYKNPEFKAVMAEIYDGMLLSQIMEEQVWERSLQDSLGQKALYELTKDNYRYPERAWATIVTTDNDSLLSRAKETLAVMPYHLKRKGTELLFTPKNANLTEQHREALFETAITMLRNENYWVEVSAYADALEADSMSELRLKNSVKALTNNRIPLTRIMEKDHGKFKPLVDAARNRRVAFQYFSSSKKDVEKALNALKIGTITIEEGVFTKGANATLNAANWTTGNQFLIQNGKRIWVDIARIEPPRQKTFAEARGAVINEYQRRLEQELLEKLKQQFPVKVNEDELRKLK